jgi:hypothetical protein
MKLLLIVIIVVVPVQKGKTVKARAAKRGHAWTSVSHRCAQRKKKRKKGSGIGWTTQSSVRGMSRSRRAKKRGKQRQK